MRNLWTISVLSAFCLVSAARARSEPIPRAEKSQFPSQTPTAPPLPAVDESPAPERIWGVEGSFGVERDNNINHLLTNLDIDSNRRLGDTALLSHAMLEAFPDLFEESVATDLSYSYDRFDYQKNPSFSFYTHELAGDLYPRITPTLELDAGASLNWSGDSSGIFSDEQSGSLGVIWKAPQRFKIKAGYEYEHDNVRLNAAKDSQSNGLYLSVARPVARRQRIYFTYRLRDNRARGADFSYRSNSLRLGWVSRMCRWFKVNTVLSYLDTPYTNVDSRFGVQRHDHTYGLLIKPTVRIVDGLDLVPYYNYLENHSNVGTKRYYDQIYGVSLEGRF
jgi:hypothetical protein